MSVKYAWYDKYHHGIVIDSIIYEGRTDGSSGCYTYEVKDDDTDVSERARRVIKDFYEAIALQKRKFEINNSQLGGDPCNGARKECTLYYRMARGAPLLCQKVYEYEFMSFDLHITNVKWGPTVVQNSAVYRRLNRALRTALETVNDPPSDGYAKDAVDVTNDNLGGDTNPGQRKILEVIISWGSGRGVNAKEGEKWPNVKELLRVVGKR
jgi:hypothetical protein